MNLFSFLNGNISSSTLMVNHIRICYITFHFGNLTAWALLERKQVAVCRLTMWWHPQAQKPSHRPVLLLSLKRPANGYLVVVTGTKKTCSAIISKRCWNRSVSWSRRYIGIYSCKNSLSRIFKICAFYYMYFISQKNWSDYK